MVFSKSTCEKKDQNLIYHQADLNKNVHVIGNFKLITETKAQWVFAKYQRFEGFENDFLLFLFIGIIWEEIFN